MYIDCVILVSNQNQVRIKCSQCIQDISSQNNELSFDFPFKPKIRLQVYLLASTIFILFIFYAVCSAGKTFDALNSISVFSLFSLIVKFMQFKMSQTDSQHINALYICDQVGSNNLQFCFLKFHVFLLFLCSEFVFSEIFSVLGAAQVGQIGENGNYIRTQTLAILYVLSIFFCNNSTVNQFAKHNTHDIFRQCSSSCSVQYVPCTHSITLPLKCELYLQAIRIDSVIERSRRGPYAIAMSQFEKPSCESRIRHISARRF